MRRIARPLAVVTGLSLLVGAPAITAFAAPANAITHTTGACTSPLGVTVVVDDQGSATPKVACVTNTDGSAYSSTDSLQTFIDAGFAMTTQPSAWGATVCKIDTNPVNIDPCGPNPDGKWWSFWTAPESAAWVSSPTGADSTAAPAGTFIGFSYVDGASDWSTPAPEPRVPTSYATPTTSTTTSTTTAPTTSTTTTSTTTAPTTSTTSTTTGPAAWTGDGASAADWLARQAIAGADAFDPINGISLLTDAYLGIATQNPTDSRLPALWSRIVAKTADFTTYVDTSTTPATTYEFGSQTAKMLVLAETAKANVHNVGGIDLAAQLARNISTGSGAAPGVVLDAGSPGNVFAQSYAVIGQARINQLNPAALTHLLGEQCASGYFRMYTRSTATTPAPCDESNSADGSDVDGTAIAVLAMVAAATNGATFDRAPIDRAVDWLIANQKPTGGFAGSTFTPDPNTNSTGLAVLALIAVRDLAAPNLRMARAALAAPNALASAITAGQGFVASAQAGSQRDSTNALAGDLGAIAYLPSDYTAATTAGLAANLSTWQRATAQGMFAFLASASGLISPVTATGPTATATATTTAPGSTTTTTTGSNAGPVASSTTSTVVSAGSTRTATGALASTGSDAAVVLALGLLLAVAGIALLLAGVLPARRRAATGDQS